MNSVETVGEYLEQLSPEIDADSQPFTLNPQRAAETLAKYQLQKSTDFLLKFVQAACQASSGLRVTEGLHCEFWGWHGGDLESIQKKFESLLSGSKDDALGCLALGLSAALAQSPAQLELFEAGEAEGQRVSLTQETALSSWDQQNKVERPEGSFSGHALLRLTFPEIKLCTKALNVLFKKRCPWTPVRISTAGHELAEVVASKRARHQFQPIRRRRPTGARALSPESKQVNWYRLDMSPTAKKPTIALVKHGVVVEELPWEEGEPGATLHLCADALPTDISGLALLKNDDYYALLRRSHELEPKRSPKPVPELEPAGDYDDSSVVFLSGLSVVCVAYLISSLGLTSAFGVGMINALAVFGMTALVEFNIGTRAARLRKPLPGMLRGALHLAACLSCFGFLYLAYVKPGLLPVWLDPRFTFAAWLPLVLDFLLNPEPRWRVKDPEHPGPI